MSQNLEVTQPMKAKLRDVIVLSQKNRQPDDNPGAKLSLEATFSNGILDFFDARLRSMLFERAPGTRKQAELDIRATEDLPNLSAIGIKVGWLPWHQEFSGCTFTIDFGLAGKSNLVIKDALLGSWKLQGKEGGSVIGRFTVESNDVDEKTFGKLAKLKSREIAILVAPPVITQSDIEDAAKAAGSTTKAKDPKPEAKPAPARKPGAAERSAAARLGGKDEPKTPHKGEERPARTARGKAQTKAALEAGKKAAAGDAKEKKASDQAAAATEAFASAAKAEGTSTAFPPATTSTEDGPAAVH